MTREFRVEFTRHPMNLPIISDSIDTLKKQDEIWKKICKISGVEYNSRFIREKKIQHYMKKGTLQAKASILKLLGVEYDKKNLEFYYQAFILSRESNMPIPFL